MKRSVLIKVQLKSTLVVVNRGVSFYVLTMNLYRRDDLHLIHIKSLMNYLVRRLSFVSIQKIECIIMNRIFQ